MLPVISLTGEETLRKNPTGDGTRVCCVSDAYNNSNNNTNNSNNNANNKFIINVMTLLSLCNCTCKQDGL